MTESPPEQAASPHAPSGGRALLWRLGGILVLLALISTLWLLYEAERFLNSPMGLGEEGMTYEVPPGSSLRVVASDLRRRGVLDREAPLVYYARMKGLAGRIKAGEFAVPAGTTPVGLLNLLVSGRAVQHSLTVVEGWSFRQALSAIHEHPRVQATLLGSSDEEIMRELGHPDQHPEGRFLPETYHFPAGTTDKEILARAHDAMRRYLDSTWAGRAEGLPLRSADEALILASIIEKETGAPEERGRIAGVFTRRLQRGMRLQTDPTVIYGLGEAFDGNLKRSHLRQDTPYNTYVHKGLPPTPIALPGAAAIDAALHPEAGDSLYFVSRGDGTHQFSATLPEHTRAVARYQLKRSKVNKP